MRAVRWLAVAAALGATRTPVRAQVVAWHGEVRPRFEYRDPVGTGADDFTVMRVRAAMDAQVDDELAVFIQLQDVRYWGEETNPSGDYTADHLDLHQGYLRYRSRGLPWLTATVGRQETGLGEERLVGISNWSPQARAFDGVRLDATRGASGVTLLGYKIGDTTAPAISDNRDFFAVYGNSKAVGPGGLDVYWLLERAGGALDTREHTAGLRYVLSGAVDARFEGAVQRGRRDGEPVSAYMLTAYVGRAFHADEARVRLWYDYLSGDDTPSDGRTEVFSTLYGTNHKSYGIADRFTNIPEHTGGHGLQDRAVKLTVKPARSLSLELDGHSFAAAREGSLSTNHFGDELDFTVTHARSEALSVMGGVSRVFQDRALAEVGRLDKDMTWAFVMLKAIF